jgi:hypothetical protein
MAAAGETGRCAAIGAGACLGALCCVGCGAGEGLDTIGFEGGASPAAALIGVGLGAVVDAPVGGVAAGFANAADAAGGCVASVGCGAGDGTGAGWGAACAAGFGNA